MLRQLLAILALVTGLAAVTEPAQAAQIAQSVESASAAEPGAPLTVAQVPVALFASVPGGRETNERRPATGDTFVSPTVLLQADRAHE